MKTIREFSVARWIEDRFEILHSGHQAIVSMEGIRGIAVFLVFLVHYVTLIEPWLSKDTATFILSSYVRTIGNIGVDLFFVLSGYLIYGMLIPKHRPFGPYFRRRVQRIYPTFTVVFLTYLLLSVAVPAESKIPSDSLQALKFIVQNYLLMPGLFDVTAIITVAWSLSYEFFYYLVTPLIVTGLSMRRWDASQRVKFVLLFSMIALAGFSIYGGPVRLLMFVPGILLYESIAAGKSSQFPWIGITCFILALVVTSTFRFYGVSGFVKFPVIGVLFYIFCLDCFTSDRVASKFFSSKPLRWLGNMSYSYYLIHGLALKFFFLILGVVYPPHGSDNLLFWTLLPLAFVITLVPSCTLFLYVEKPFSIISPSRPPELTPKST